MYVYIDVFGCKILLKFVPTGPIDNNLPLVQLNVRWQKATNHSLNKLWFSFLTDIYLTRPQWINHIRLGFTQIYSTVSRHGFYYLRHGEGYVFIVVRCFVYLSVCLLATLWKNGWTDFHEILSVGGSCHKEQLGTFFMIFNFTPWTKEFFLLFRRNPCLLAALQKKRLNGFSWNLQKRTDPTQGAIWNIFGKLTPWILGRFIYFLDPWKNGWTDLHEILMKRRARPKK